MKKPSLKSLCLAISGLMAMMATSVSTASDTEIYQEAEEGTVTLMLLLDLSGSMHLTSIYDDYRAIKIDPSHPYAQNNLTGYSKGAVTSQFESKDRNGSTANWSRSYNDNITYKLDTDISPYGVTRYYFAVPKTAANNVQINYNLNNGKNNGGKDLTGCPVVTNTAKGYDEYRCYTRLSRMQDAFIQVLSEKDANGDYLLDDNKVIGMSVFSAVNGSSRDGQSATILSPALPLGEKVGSGTHRDFLIKTFRELTADAGTPTANAYAETMAYMFGTNVNDGVAREYFYTRTNGTGSGICMQFSGTNCAKADVSGWEARNLPTNYSYLTQTKTGKRFSLFPNGTAYQRAITADILKGQYQGGFISSVASSKNTATGKYISPASLVAQKNNPSLQQCSGQGIYVLTDGEPNTNYFAPVLIKGALGSHGGSFSCDASWDYGRGWDCMHKAAEALLDPAKNPSGLKIKTAVIGFGTEFNNVPSYNPSLTKADNLKNADNSSGSYDVKRAARWGILGEGGWYSGNNADDIISSINAFIAQLQTDIPTTVTGQPFIPIDPLNPLTYMNDAYYGAFTPLPGKKKTFWAGDMNKYLTKDQSLHGTNGRLFDKDGNMIPTIKGYWGDGMTHNLPLRSPARPVFSNYGTGTNTALTKIDLTELYSATPRTRVADRNAWLNLIGYNVSLSGDPVAQSALSATPELRQLGALLHSTPIILTQKGKVNRSGTGLDTSQDRKDYILYGSTQGILHIVDTDTGVEKIAFVPKEMMDTQKNNFQHVDNSSGVMGYGVDGEWTAYTQYISDGHGGFTVNGANGATSTTLGTPTLATSSAGATSTNLGNKGVQWVYGGLRMGGRSYYALDLSDIDNPKLKFHIDPASAGAGSPLSYMGQSWSKPTLGFVNWYNTTTKVKERRLVMFVGGGYDTGYENRLYDQTNGIGGGVYMFDAHDGELLWWASSHATTSKSSTGLQSTNNPHLKYSVPSDIATFDRNNDGLIDQLLFGDLGGQVFRVDLDNFYDHEAGDNLATRVVRVYNGHQAGGLSPRFYEAPSLSIHSGIGASGQFGVISIASGNRSSPLATGAESAKDALFVIYDHDILRANMVKKSMNNDLNVTDASIDKLVTLTPADIISGDEKREVKAVNNAQGWKYYLSTTAGNLKGYSSPRVVSNFLFLNTYDPRNTTAQNVCSAGIIGTSHQEVFCMPGGVCTKEQAKILDMKANENISDITKDDGTGGSPRRMDLGLGILQTAVGNTNDGSNKSTSITYAPIDCTSQDNKGNLACLTEMSSISNKPVRWYENNPRS